MTAKTKCLVNAPTEMVRSALTLAAAQRKRAAVAAANQYGTDHIMTQTLKQEEALFTHAATTLTEA